MAKSAPQPKTQNLQDGGVEALQALFSSIAPLTDGGSGGGGGGGKPASQLTPEVLKKLSDRLTEFVGEGPAGTTHQPVNEEGLPIIEITEPEEGSAATATATAATDNPEPESESRVTWEEEPLVPPSSLSPSERERRRLERDRILDALEKEETQLQAHEAQAELRRSEEEHLARKERVKEDLDKLKAAKAMQKKMGKALLRHMAQDKEKEEGELKDMERRDEERRKAKLGEEKKVVKKVSFAQMPDSLSSTSKAGGGGGSSTKLRSPGPGSEKKSFDEEQREQIMKLNVVERFPVQSSSSSSSSSSLPAVSSSAPAPEESSDDEDIDADDGEDDSDIDVDEEADYARQQRQLAEEYLQRKNKMGQEFLQAMSVDTSVHTDDWEQENVPLEATLSHPPPRPSQSRFKSSLAQEATASTSLPGLIVPASTVAQVSRSVRYGTLDENGQLVAGPEGESDDEGEGEGEQATDEMKEILELLKRGEIQNIGPSKDVIPAAPIPSAKDRLSRYDPDNPKRSVFKPTASVGRRSEGSGASSSTTTTTTTTTPDSRSQTPISSALRSSPKIAPSPASGVVVERQPPGPTAGSSSLKSTVTVPQPSPPTVESRTNVVEPASSNSLLHPSLMLADPPSVRLRQPPVIISSVKEKEPTPDRLGAELGPGERPMKMKVSRFKTERGL